MLFAITTTGILLPMVVVMANKKVKCNMIKLEGAQREHISAKYTIML